uniref:Ig-like domain-containing protein n=1 Tax=Meleagris gallopavo TaxID=9103 RepID=A0A803XQ25_MELGA
GLSLGHSRLAVLAAFSLLLIHGHAQVLLQQSPPSVTKMGSKSVTIECKAEGIANFQAAYIHWYRQLPDKAPERLLYVTAASQVSYDSESYRNKYSSYKRENNICTLSVDSIQDGDAGTYYCAYWE